MHAIEIIVSRNAQAAGRELGLTINDLPANNSIDRALAIEREQQRDIEWREYQCEPVAVVEGIERAFARGYFRGRQEG